ncbi:MAG: hypothetical protein IJ309_01225 [Clostridia bacterium]|nr:hypothetical protein [Clostridia bacterium]
MKYRLIKSNKEEIKSKIKNTLEVMSLVFVLSAFTMLMYFATKDTKTIEYNENNSVAEVFKETGLYDALDFDEIDKTGGDVAEISQNNEELKEG